ncbi:MAG: restriction endonuclease [Rubrobacteraceae bacterium]|nr:restriction endonuclease [Rubrobacteraceae bacterium]
MGILISLFIRMMLLPLFIGLWLLRVLLHTGVHFAFSLKKGSRLSRRRRKTGDGSTAKVLLAVIVGLGLFGYNVWLGLFYSFLLAGYLILKSRPPRTPEARELLGMLQQVPNMSGETFEDYVALIFRALGYPRVLVLGGSGDQGVDIILEDNTGHRVAIQCKNYKRAVGNKPVQEVYAGMRHHECDEGWVVAPQGFTAGAYEIAASTGVKLFDRRSMLAWIKLVDERERKDQQERENEQISSASHPFETGKS